MHLGYPTSTDVALLVLFTVVCFKTFRSRRNPSDLHLSLCRRFFSNRVFLPVSESPPSHSTPGDSVVEWAYAFDVHTNAFFPRYLTLYLAQLFLLLIILKSNWICLFVSNTLYLAAFAKYIYGIYLGLNALPFLIRTELLLAPLLPLFTGYIVSLLEFNIAKHVLPAYFGSRQLYLDVRA